MEKISLKKVLEIIRYKDAEGNPSVFDVSVWSLNKNSKTGGKLTDYKSASKSTAKKAIKRSAREERELLKLQPKKKRNPNHKKNRTINIDVPGITHPVAIHYRLITMFNGKRVHY